MCVILKSDSKQASTEGLEKYVCTKLYATPTGLRQIIRSQGAESAYDRYIGFALAAFHVRVLQLGVRPSVQHVGVLLIVSLLSHRVSSCI